MHTAQLKFVGKGMHAVYGFEKIDQTPDRTWWLSRLSLQKKKKKKRAVTAVAYILCLIRRVVPPLSTSCF